MTSRCYAIDGQPYASLDRYIPCNATAAATGKNTACCAPGDNCLTNGMCQSQLDNKRKANIFWRNGCTDPTWKDPACPKYCEGIDGPLTHGIHYCLSSNSYCCPTGPLNSDTIVNTTCCDKQDLTFSAIDPVVYTIAHVNIISTALASIQGAATSVAVAAPPSALLSYSIAVTAFAQPSTTQNIPLASFTPASSSDNKIGIYVGVPLAIALAIALAVVGWLIIKLKRKNAARYAYAVQGGLIENGTMENRQPPEYVNPREAETLVAEMPDQDHSRAELGFGKGH